MGPPYAPKTCGIVPAFQSRERDTRGIRHEHRQRRRSAGSKALARELDQAADATVRAMNEVVSAPAALAVYRRDQDVPPWTGLPTRAAILLSSGAWSSAESDVQLITYTRGAYRRWLGSRPDSEELRAAGRAERSGEGGRQRASYRLPT